MCFEYRLQTLSLWHHPGQPKAAVLQERSPWCCGAGLLAVLPPFPPSAVAATCSVYSLSPYTHMSICLVFTWKESALRLPYQIRRPIPHRTPFMPPTRKVSDAAASIIQPLFSCSRATCYRSNSPGHCRPGPNPRSLRGGRVMQNLPPDGHGF